MGWLMRWWKPVGVAYVCDPETLRAELARERAVVKTLSDRNRILETQALDDAEVLSNFATRLETASNEVGLLASDRDHWKAKAESAESKAALAASDAAGVRDRYRELAEDVIGLREAFRNVRV